MAEGIKGNTQKKRSRVKRVLLSSTIIGSIIVSGNLVSASELSTNQNSNSAISSTKVRYNDFKDGQYWSKDMLWAIDEGLIQGYLNRTHPTNKKNKTKGNWLNPYGNLTEAQMVTVLFKYAKPDEFANTTPASDWWASTAYQLAAKYKVPTAGSIKNKSKASGIVTRGSLARAIATIHYGKQMSLKDSVQFMYDAGLSSGKDVSKGKTYANFGVNDKLARAHIVVFLKRYDEFLKAGGDVTQPENPSSIIAPSENNKVLGITVKYGSHTYATKSQAEYDKVMSIVQGKIKKDYHKIQLANNEISNQAYLDFLDGVRGIKDRTDPNFRTQYNSSLVQAEGKFGDLVDAGYSKETIIEIDKGISIARSLISGATIPDGPSRSGSAYTLLVGGVRTGYSEATVFSAVFDSLGYKTVILTNIVDGYYADGFLVEVEGKWVDVSYSFSHKLSTVDIEELFSKGYRADVFHL
jgi:hypothetical protein